MSTKRKEFHDVATGENIPIGNGGWEDIPNKRAEIDGHGRAKAHDRHRDDDMER